MANRSWNDEELKVLAGRIRILRKMLRLTQVEFAERLGVSESNVSKVERGAIKVSHTLMRRIETIYEINLGRDIDNENWLPTEIPSLIVNWSEYVREQRETLPPITKRIFELMEERNITQKELADSIGMTRASVSAWKRKRIIPSADAIIPICKLLDVTPFYILDGKEEGMAYPAEYL